MSRALLGASALTCATLTLASLFLLADTGVRAQSSVTGEAEEELVGVWSARRVFGPRIREDLTIWRLENPQLWRAQVSDVDVEFTSADDTQVAFRLPNDRGAFRGRFDAATGQLRGHWIEAPSSTLNYPVASPVHFERLSLDADVQGWRGAVRPQVNEVNFHLRVLPERADEAEGRLRAFVRNPERNLGIFLGLQSVRRQGRRVELHLRDGDVISGDFDTGREENREDDRLSVHFDQLGVTFDFRRAPVHTSFYPARDEPAYNYRVPLPREDGWSVSAAGEQGFDERTLEQAVRSVRSEEAQSVNDPYIHALLVSRHGELVLEEYFHGFGPETPHDTRSAGKSLASLIAGLAVDRDRSFSSSTLLATTFGSRADEPQLDDESLPPHSQRARWRGEVTLGHLLSMSSGLECDDGDNDSLGNEGRLQSQSDQPSWRTYTLGVPTVRPPGQTALYCSAGIDLALAMVNEATGSWLPELFAEGLAEPLGIREYHFNLSPAWDGYMGGGIYLKPRDLLKLGQLVIGRGEWNGRAVLSAEWIEESTSPRASVNQADDYGLGWWNEELVNPKTGRSHRAIYASGNGGQLIIAIPDFEIVVLFSAGNYNNFPVWIRFLREFVPEHILGAVEQARLPAASSP